MKLSPFLCRRRLDASVLVLGLLLAQTAFSGAARIQPLSATRTGVERIATVRADSITLAALGHISLSGVTLNASQNLSASAGGNILSDAVQTGSTL